MNVREHREAACWSEQDGSDLRGNKHSLHNKLYFRIISAELIMCDI